MAAVTSHEASSFTPGHAYDVFLSFRGEDTRKAFTDHLYTALVHKGIHTFRDDDEIARGEDIKSKLKKAIMQSRISIVVFSKNYASSRWCLDELVFILKSRRTSTLEVLPVFYHVDPSEVRRQTGTFAEAFARHERILKAEADQRNNEWMDKVEGWRAALREAADLSGMVFRNQIDGHESKFIQEIVSEVLRMLNHQAAVVASPFLIGIDSRAKNINLWLTDGSSDVGIIAICGMGGIGKTTIAKAVYSLNSINFEGSSFLVNIREVSGQPNGIVRLQRQLISDIQRGRKEIIVNVDEGIRKIKDAVYCKRVLVVLDDVDEVGQLDAILGMRDWFYPGSKIIITTRNKYLLNRHNVSMVCTIETLDIDESLELFSWHAFGQCHPIEGYMEYSRRIVQYSGGLPLALEALASSLCGMSIDAWESALNRLKAVSDTRILQKLKISYDSLFDDHDKDLFLHIACFFVGKDIDCTVTILDACDFYTTVGIQNLINKCLLKIDNNNKIMMHRLLQEMGRQIVRFESPKEPGKRSRLWHHEDSFRVLSQNTGSAAIEGLVLDMHAYKKVNSAQEQLQSSLDRYRFGFLSFHRLANASKNSNKTVLHTSAFVRMFRLKLLQLRYVQLSGSYDEFPRSLRWLCWHGFALESIPNDFPVDNLVALDMRYSSLKRVWKGNKFLGLLKILNLSHCHNLTSTPDFSVLPNLERLNLKDCKSLVEIHESIGHLERLVFLNLKDCKNLRKLPRSIIFLKSVETLIISGCSKLNELPTELKKLESLKVFAANGIVINELATGEVKSWQELVWSKLSMPSKSPKISWASLPRCLTSLNLVDCNLSDDNFPRDLRYLSSLQSLNLSKNPINSLPYSIRGLTGLQTLQLESCTMLRSLVGLPSLKKLNVSDCTLLENITFQSLLTTSEIAFPQCYNLVEFQPCLTIEPIGEVDTEMIHILGWSDFAKGNLGDFHTKKFHIFEGLHEYGIFSTFFPARKVPSWFSHRSMGSSMSFTWPSLPHLGVRGFSVCSVYAFSDSKEQKLRHPLFAKIRNKSKGLKWIYGPSCLGVPKEDGDMIWLSHWKLGNQFDGGDEVSVSMFMDVGFVVKEYGINLVYEQEVSLGTQENASNPSHEGVIDGDLSRYEITTGTYFLCSVVYDWSGSLWFDKLIGDSDETTDAGFAGMEKDSEIKSSKRRKVEVDDDLVGMEKYPKIKSSKRRKVEVDDNLVGTEKVHENKPSKRTKGELDDVLVGIEKDREIKSSKRIKVPLKHKSVQVMMGAHLAQSFSAKSKKKYSGRREILKLAGEKVLETPSSEPGDKEELEEMRRKAEELKREAKVLKRRTDFIRLILSYPMQPEAEKQSQPCVGINFSRINQQIRRFEASILDEYNGRCSNESPEDINRNLQELFHEVEGKLAEYDFEMAAYLPQDMVENMRDPPDSDMECSSSITDHVYLLMPTSTKSENAMRSYEDGMFLRAPQVIRKLAINSAVHQILGYFEDRRFGKIGISGSGWEEVAKALKDLPKIRNLFDVVQSVSPSQHQSIKELLMNILNQAYRPSDFSRIRLLLLVDSIDQQIDLHDLDLADTICVVLKIPPQNVNEIMALDLEIRMEDHLLPWNLFCKNVGGVLDHSSTLQQKAVRLIEECHRHLLAIILLARALKDVSDASVWELALNELMWQPLSEVQGMNVVMINVLRFIWERMGISTKNCVKYCCSLPKGEIIGKHLLIYEWIMHGWIKTRDEGEHIHEELTTSFLLENVGKHSFRMRQETRLVLLNIFIPDKDPAFLKRGNLGLTETPKIKEWYAKEINLMNNKLSELPESPSCLFLVKLFLQGNCDLMVIPPSFFECMPVLQVLNFSYTNIKSLPKSIAKLVTLREFFLRGCDRLMELPPEIGALKNLEVFDLQGTELMYLPKEIGEIVGLTSLKVSFTECADLCKEIKGVDTIIPKMALSNLFQLNELSIDIQPNSDWWDIEVKDVINELCSLKSMRILKLYVPITELLRDLRWDSTSLIYPTLTHFKFIVGSHVQRFISRPTSEVAEKFEKFEKSLKYISGEIIPTEITKVLKHADAFYLERHWTVKNLSEFGLENMDKLKFCCVVACNEFHTIIKEGNCEEDDSDESEHNSDFDEEIVLGSLQYLSVHYMKNMESICKGPVGKGCLSNLKSLALHTCHNLTTIFTLGMLRNLINLEEVMVEDCPKIISLVSLRHSSMISGHFLPRLKKISLLELPELVSISSGLRIAPKLESLVIFYCPNLKMLSCMEVSSKDLKVIKGENEWWDALKWHDSDLSSDHRYYLAHTFIPIKMDGDLMTQLTED